MKFEVYATITEVYYIEADSFDHALELASEREQPDDTTAHGFDYVINVDNREELIL